MKFKLHDIRESKVWQEANKEGKQEGEQEGREQGREEGRIHEREDTIRKCLAKGMTAKQIAEMLEISVAEVHRLGNGHPK